MSQEETVPMYRSGHDGDVMLMAVKEDQGCRNQANNILQSNGDVSGAKIDVEDSSDQDLLYRPQDHPPLLVALVLGFQTAIGGVLGGLGPAIIVGDLICADINDAIRFRIFCSSVFMMGVTTILQTTMGIRLPIFQGISGAFFSPLLALRASKVWKCDVTAGNHSLSENYTLENKQDFLMDEKYQRLHQIEGSLMLAACFEVIIGMTGLVGYLLKLVSPVTVAVTITLISMGIYPFALEKCAIYWPVSAASCVCMVLCSLYLSNYKIRVPACGIKLSHVDFPLFRSFPVLFAWVLGTVICVVLTYAGALSDKPSDLSYMARTDIKLDLNRDAPWIMIPYPFQFGMPTINAGLTIAFVAAFISSAIESLGDYMNLALICGLSPPPRHAVNRGILTEGLMAIISGSMGIGHATTSHSDNIAIVQLTRVASRDVMVYGGAMLVIVSLFGKFGALMTTLPDPVLGGAFLFLLGCLLSIGVSSLRFAYQNPGRNLVIFGFSVYAAFIISEWTKLYSLRIKTGNIPLDGVLISLLGTPMLLGGVISVFLDNTVPGEKASFSSSSPGNLQDGNLDYVEKQYRIPVVHKFLQRFSWTQKLPFV